MPFSESLDSRPVPTVSFDAHFALVPRLEEVRFDPERCADLFTHPNLGILDDYLSRIHVYVRPDYRYYPPEERRALKELAPDDYKDAASTEPLEKSGPYGQKNDVLMTIVYGSGYDPNALLCNQAVFARNMLKKWWATAIGDAALSAFLPDVYRARDKKEKREADQAMKDVDLKDPRQGVIEIIRAKKKN